MLSAFSKNPNEAVDFKWPEFQPARMEEITVPEVPGAEGFSDFAEAQKMDQTAPKPVVQTALFEDLKPIEP